MTGRYMVVYLESREIKPGKECDTLPLALDEVEWLFNKAGASAVTIIERIRDDKE